MKKIVSLLLTLALLCCSIVPALAESQAPVITVTEFKAAMEKLASEFIGWEMKWQTEEGFGVVGNMGNNPILLTSGEYVTMAMVNFTVTASDDMESLADLFIITGALTAACPAVRDGVAVTAAPDMVFADLQGMLATLTAESPLAIGTLYGATAMVMLSEEDDGSIEMTLLLTYTDPNAAE